MKSIIQKIISLNSLAFPIIKTNTSNSVSRFTLLLFLFIILSLNPYVIAYTLTWATYYSTDVFTVFNFTTILLSSYLIITIMLQTKTWLSEIINGLLEGLGSFNNTIHPNENRTKDLQELLNKQRELIEQQETQNWRNRLKEDYKK